MNKEYNDFTIIIIIASNNLITTYTVELMNFSKFTLYLTCQYRTYKQQDRVTINTASP